MSRYQIVSNEAEDMGQRTFFEIEANKVQEINGVVYFWLKNDEEDVQLVAQFHILHWMWLKL